MLGSDEVPFAVVYIEPILQGSIIGIEGAVPSTGHIQVEEAVSVVIKKYGLQILAAPVRFQRGLSNGYEPPVPLLQKEPSRLVVPSPREHIDETEVQNRRYSGEVAARRHLLGVLLLPTRINRHLGTESEGVLSCPLEFYLEIIVVIRLVGGSILEHRGVFVNVVRNKIQVAIIIQIPVGRPRTLERRIQSPMR